MATPNVQISDGLKNKILGVESVRDILRGGRIDCWTGAAPVDANAALPTVSKAAAAITLDIFDCFFSTFSSSVCFLIIVLFLTFD